MRIPRRPCQRRLRAVEVAIEAAVADQLVDQQQPPPAVAPADELHQVPVAQPADDGDLGPVLLPPFHGRAPREHLDSDVTARLLQVATVHRPRPALTQLPLRREVLRGRRELGVGDGAGPRAGLEVTIVDGVEGVVAVRGQLLFVVRLLAPSPN